MRGGQGRDDEYTCEIDQLYEDANGEMVAKVRWFYWPVELHTKRKLKNMPSFSAKREVILSEEYNLIDIGSISKKCDIVLLRSTNRIPDRCPKDTLYCKWKITKGSKEILPILPATPLPVNQQKEEHETKENEPTPSKKKKTMPNVEKTLKRKKFPSASKKQRAHSAHKEGEEDTNLFQAARERCRVNNVYLMY